jgi:excisionase family DNA binding protein
MRRSREQPSEAPALDPLSALIRDAVSAAVRAEFEALRIELLCRQPAAGSSLETHLTLREAAKALRCSERKTRRLLATGRLRAAKLATGGSSRLLIARAEIDRLLAESTHAA